MPRSLRTHSDQVDTGDLAARGELDHPRVPPLEVTTSKRSV